MANEIIQADYEQLDQIALRFARQSEATAELGQRLAQAFQPLESGGWLGRGAEAFFKEMTGELLPALERMQAAFNQADQTTQEISQLVRQAEEEAASVFQGEGTAVAPNPGANVPGVGPGAPGQAPVNGAGPGSQSSSTAGSRPDNDHWLLKKFNEGFGNLNALLDWAFDQGPRFKGLRGMLQTALKTPLSQAFFGELSTMGKIGGVLSGVTGAAGDYFESQDEMAKGMNFENALSQEAAEATIEVEARLALYAIPGVNLVTLGHDVLHLFGVSDTDYIEEYVAEPVGRAADKASTAIADGLYALQDHDQYFQTHYPKTTIKDYERAGQVMPESVAKNVFRGLMVQDFDEAKTFWRNYAEQTGRSPVPPIFGF